MNPMPSASAGPGMPPGVLVTGIAGNLGRRLAPLLRDSPLLGVDLVCPTLDHPCTQFYQLDVSHPEASVVLAQLIEEHNIRKVIHLAFVLDPVRTGAREEPRQWEINVQGTRHVLEAIQRANRGKLQVELFIYLSSVTAYGSNLPQPVREEAPLEGHTLPYAIHKRETDWLCRASHRRLRGCAVYVLRAHIFLGKEMDNFILRAFRGQPSGTGRLARWVSWLGWRLPVILPRGQRYDGLFQFVHVDDVARLLYWICGHYEPGKLQVFNVQGKGRPVTNPECVAIAQARMLRLPSYPLVQFLFRLLWGSGLSGVPPQALPYFTGSYVMNCDRLKGLLGEEYDAIIRFTTEETLREAFS